MEHTQELLPAAHRPLRRVEAHEAAVAGELVTDGERMRVRVDADAVPAPLWAFAAAEHVAGVRDVLRRRDGHDALLPWCADRVDAFLGRRAAAGRALAPGEIVTLVGSMLRGVGEVGDAPVQGRWWLGDDQRPLFAPGEGVSCVAATRAVVERLRAGGVDRALDRLLADIVGQPDAPRAWTRRLDHWERELTELAAPRALEVAEEPAPARVTAIPLHQALLPAAAEQVATRRGSAAQRTSGSRDARVARAERTPRRAGARSGFRSDGRAGERPRRARPLGALARRAGPAIRARAASLIDAARTRMPAAGQHREAVDAAAPAVRVRAGGRGRMLLVGAAVAAVVVLAGLMWPAEEDSSAHEQTVAPDPTQTAPMPAPSPGAGSASATPSPTGAPVAEERPAETPPSGDAGASTGAAQAAVTLLKTIGACAAHGDSSCPAAVVEGAAQTVRDRLGDDVTGREPALVEDYGDIAVVRLAAGSARGEQMLVLVRQDDEWLVRDVYDVADQPSGGG